jgi:hypothetical protein
MGTCPGIWMLASAAHVTRDRVAGAFWRSRARLLTVGSTGIAGL